MAEEREIRYKEVIYWYVMPRGMPLNIIVRSGIHPVQSFDLYGVLLDADKLGGHENNVILAIPARGA